MAQARTEGTGGRADSLMAFRDGLGIDRASSAIQLAPIRVGVNGEAVRAPSLALALLFFVGTHVRHGSLPDRRIGIANQLSPFG